MPLIKPDAAMRSYLQDHVAALAAVHREVAALCEATDLETLVALNEQLEHRLYELCPPGWTNERPDQRRLRLISEDEKQDFRGQIRNIVDTRRRLLDSGPATMPS